MFQKPCPLFGSLTSVVAFLATPASSFMTGSVVTVDGGYNA